MGREHSGDLRERVYGEVAGGGSRRAAARSFGVSASTGVRMAGSLAPARQGRPAGGGKLAVHHALLIRWVEAEGDVTMPELAEHLADERQVVAHPASLSRYLQGGLYRQKKRCWRTRPDPRT